MGNDRLKIDILWILYIDHDPNKKTVNKMTFVWYL